MSTIRIFCSIMLISLCFAFSWKQSISLKDKFNPLGKYLADGKVSASLTALGGHQGNCMSITMKNTSKDTLFLYLEPGRRLYSSDTSMQDILIVKKQTLFLLPLSEKKINGYGFCCESTNKSPGQGTPYTIGQMAPESWIKLCKLINENDFPKAAVQSAVWVLSDDHSIASVFDEDEKKILKLRKLLAELKGVDVPWYAVTYEKDTSRLFSNRPEYILGNIDYTLKNNAVVSIVVRDKWGAIAKMLVEESAKGPGEKVYDLELNVKGWQKGEYVITVMEDYSNLNCSKKFIIE